MNNKLTTAARAAQAGDLEKARKQYQILVEETQGTPWHATALNGYGNVLIELGMAREAVDAYAAALQIFKRNPDWPKDNRALTALCNYAVALRDAGMVDEGLKEGRLAVALRRELFEGKPHADLAVALNNLGVTLSRMRGGEFAAEGLRCHLEAFDVYVALNYKAGQSTTLYNIAMTYVDFNEFSRAVDVVKQYRTVTVEAYGAAHPRSVQAIRDVGEICLLSGRRDEGNAALDEYVKIVDGWTDRAAACRAYAKVAQILRRSGQSERAEELGRKA